MTTKKKKTPESDEDAAALRNQDRGAAVPTLVIDAVGLVYAVRFGQAEVRRPWAVRSSRGGTRNRGPANEAAPGVHPARDIDRNLNR